jgi:hypothetical protein
MQRSSSAKGYQHKLAWIVAASDGHGPNGPGHIIVDDLDDSCRSIVEAKPEGLGDPVLDDLSGGLSIQRNLTAQ